MPDPRPKRPGRHRRGGDLEGLRRLQEPGRDARRDSRAAPDPWDDRPVGPPPAAGASAVTVGHTRRRPVRRLRLRRRWPRRILLLVNLAVALSLVAAVGAVVYVRRELGNIHKVTVAGLSPAASGPFTMLIVGSDSRQLTGSGNAQFGSAAETPGQRSDTIMLARIVPATRSITLLSIPRDLWVPIRGIGDSRINAAFNTGPDLLVTTIESDLGIPINHYVEVNFDTFRDITDAVGGVKVWFPTPAQDAFSLLSVPTAGCVNLTGDQALAYVRSRHYQYEIDGQWITQAESDLARIQRQQNYVKRMLRKAEARITDPLTATRILSGITKNLTVDRGLSTGLMLGLAADFRTANVAGIPTETLPVNNEVIDGADVLSLAQPEARAMIQSFDTLGTASATPATTTPVATPAATSATTAAPPPVPVEVANGTGVDGQAAQAAGVIARTGDTTTVDGSSPATGLARSVIDYAPDALAAARRLDAALGGGAVLTESPALTPTPYSLEFITGRNWTGSRIAGGAAPKAPATTATTAPPAPTTTYLLPGPQPTPAELASCS